MYAKSYKKPDKIGVCVKLVTINDICCSDLIAVYF